MVTNKTTKLILAMGVAAWLSGCGNPLSDSNPVKDYPSANTGKPYVPGEKEEPKPAPDNTQEACIPPMHVSINPDHGSLAMVFTEGEATTYRVTVFNRAGQDYDITSNMQENLRQVEKTKEKATYDFTWAPEKSRNERVIKVLRIIYNYRSEIARNLCGQAEVGINLNVYKTISAPSVSFTNLPASIAYGTESVGFQVIVDDPASTQDMAPDIAEIGFTSQGNTGRRSILDASDAVTCENGAYVEGTKWVFNCTLTPSKIKGLKSTSTSEVQASFYVIGVSKRNHDKKSSPASATFSITYTQESNTGA